MRHIVLCMMTAACSALNAGAALAGDAVVVELYTSQGCSSCPPADALLHSLGRNPDLIPLALHVDYWDYIGWKDIFAHHRFSDRQYAYARAMGSSMVYTPQIIVQGQTALKSATKAQLNQAIANLQAGPKVAIGVEPQADMVTISVASDGAGPAFVQLVRYRPEQVVTIERGENAGEVITYSNIVTEWNRLGDWNGTGRYEVTVPLAGPDEAVVIVQSTGPGRILAAYRID